MIKQFQLPLKHQAQATPKIGGLRNLVKDRLLKATQFCPDNFENCISANPELTIPMYKELQTVNITLGVL